MKERPILFSGPMVRAILDGTKSQTRRIVKPPRDRHNQLPYCFPHPNQGWIFADADISDIIEMIAHGQSGKLCPHGKPGDRLWVRETYANCRHGSNHPECIEYRATFGGIQGDDPKWKPSIFMPRWASRITLEITDVRVERLQDISEADAIAEGCQPTTERLADGSLVDADARSNYAVLWDSINGKRADWHSDPWVWIITFKQIK